MAKGAARGGERPLSLLVVDDERLFLRSLEYCLTEAGHKLLIASSAAEALALIEQHPGPLDVLLTDVCLDGAQGRTVSRSALEKHPAIATLYMSALPRERLIADDLIPAAAELVEKPFTPDELVRRIAALAPRLKKRSGLQRGVDGPPA